MGPIKIDLHINPPGVVEGRRYTGASWQLCKNLLFLDNTDTNSDMVLNIKNSQEYMSEYSFNYPLGKEETLYFRTMYHFEKDIIVDGIPSVEYTDSGWSMISSLRGEQRGIKISSNIVNTPIVWCDISYEDDIHGVLTINTNTMSMFAGVGTHESTTYRIRTSQGVVYERIRDKSNLTSLSIPFTMFEAGRVYVVECAHHNNVNADSLYGVAMLSTMCEQSKLFDIEMANPNCKFMPHRYMYFKFKSLGPTVISADIILTTATGEVIAECAGQQTETPRIFTGELQPGQEYFIKARVWDQNGFTPYVTIYKGRPQSNRVEPINIDTQYPNVWTYRNQVNTKGGVIQVTRELCSGAIISGMDNDSNLYKFTIGKNGMLNTVKPIVNLIPNNNGELGEVYLNVVPLRTGSVLIDYANAVSSSSCYRPKMWIADYNPITDVLSPIKSVQRTNELKSTGVSGSMASMSNGMVYYIPAVLTNSNTTGMLPLVLKRIDTESGTDQIDIIDEATLPFTAHQFVSMVRWVDDNLIVFGGVNTPAVFEGNDTVYTRSNNAFYMYTISTKRWTKLLDIADTDVVLDERIYNFHMVKRHDNKIAVFNSCNSTIIRNDQSVLIFDVVNNTVEYPDIDHGDSVPYQNTIICMSGDVYRVSCNETDPQKVYRYVAGNIAQEDILDETITDSLTDIIVRENDVVTIYDPWRYDTITIEGDSAINTGKVVVKIESMGYESIFDKDSLILTRDTIIEQNLYLGIKQYNKIGLFAAPGETIYVRFSNIVILPAGVTFELFAPVELDRIVLGEGAVLHIKDPTRPVDDNIIVTYNNLMDMS